MYDTLEFYKESCKKLFQAIWWKRIASFLVGISATVCLLIFAMRTGGDLNTDIFISAVKGGWLFVAGINMGAAFYIPSQCKPLKDILALSRAKLTYYFWFRSGWLIFWSATLNKTLVASVIATSALLVLTTLFI